MKHLKSLLDLLKELNKIRKEKEIFYVPKMWNVLNYNDTVEKESRPEEIGVDVYDFYIYYLEYIFNESYRAINGGSNIANSSSVIYSAHLRSLTAWNHYNEEIECGTFLKAIILLPYIESMNIDIIYLLPIFRTGTAYKKGNMGSAYAVKNLYKLDCNLHDYRLGTCTDELLELQFKAFVESCHSMGIKVMLDFTFRTVSRDCDLILSHPEWFYWINYKKSEGFKPLYFKEFEPLTYVSKECISTLYENKALPEYLDNFTFSPDIKDEKKWKVLVARCKNNPDINILDEIHNEFNITTAPAFSDVLNDYQDTWDDVTYIRLSFDIHEQAKKYIDPNRPPYILQDIAKASVCCGQNINYEFWNYINGVIPYYERNYAIDGARIDMAHALPDELNQTIISGSRKLNENFILWSEECQIEKSKLAQKQGFNFISGQLWEDFRKYDQKDFLINIVKDVSESKLPVVAALETPDTLRITTFVANDRIKFFLFTVSCFFPNTITMINNGIEIGERQPMNYGFDKIDDISVLLDEKDEMKGLLSLFDNYRLHWTNAENYKTKEQLSSLLKIKKQYQYLFFDNKSFTDLSMSIDDIKMLIWRYMSGKKAMLILSSMGDNHSIVINLNSMFRKISRNIEFKISRIFYINAFGKIVYLNNTAEIQLNKFDIIFALNF